MDMDMIKEANIEYCDNLYALCVTYLRKKNNNDLKIMLSKVIELQQNIRYCNDINELFNYKKYLEQLSSGIEVIINA